MLKYDFLILWQLSLGPLARPLAAQTCTWACSTAMAFVSCQRGLHVFFRKRKVAVTVSVSVQGTLLGIKIMRQVDVSDSQLHHMPPGWHLRLPSLQHLMRSGFLLRGRSLACLLEVSRKRVKWQGMKHVPTYTVLRRTHQFLSSYTDEAYLMGVDLL